MTLGPGARLGPYEVTALIGEGGMGQVYRATDTNLGRQVAIKVLPDAFAADPERLARLEREARTLASLNHPNIAIIHGFEKADGVRALVMELVEGPTLADRITQGLIPVEEALPIAKQIAEALEAAHAQGIIHRDLKPANIKVRADGTVKVLDFGLAKALEPASAMSPSLTYSPTITSPAMMTGVGMLLGTAAYMSPEQARGKAVDKRTDIWAFGCVLYEMLTGKRAFPGDDVSETLANVIKGEPDWNLLPANTHSAARRLLRRCLQKDANDRLHDISDARIEITEARATTDPVMATVASPVSVGRRERVAWTLLALCILTLALSTVLYLRRTVPDPVVTSLDVVTPPTIDPFSFALSPDGRQLAFVASGERGSQLFVRPFDQTTGRPLAGTEGASYPFWSPDGRALGFFAAGKLKRVDLAASVPQTLADAPGARGGTWNQDSVIVYALQFGGLLRVAATGGESTPVTHVTAGQGSHRWPQFLPDGRRFLFLVALGLPSTHGVYLASLDGGEPTRLLAGETAAVYASPGYLLQVVQDVLVAHRFDVDTGVVASESVLVAQGVGTDDGTFRSAFAVSATGVLAHRTGTVSRRQLAWVDRTGKTLSVAWSQDDALISSPELAPDARRVASWRVVQNNFDVWLIDAIRGIPQRFTFDPSIDNTPIWSPDGSRIAFASNRDGQWDLFERPANGTVDERKLLPSDQDEFPVHWSLDGRFLLYVTRGAKTRSDLWALPMVGERTPVPVAQSDADERQGQFSPDGQWVAYVSNETGRDEVYIRSFPAPGGKWQVSSAGGSDPRWRPNGQELFYVAPDDKLMAVPIQVARETHTLNHDAPLALFSAGLATGSNINVGWFSKQQYAVAADGRFLMNISENTAVSPVTIVQNWTTALKQ